jgi:transcriptional regulator with XRE-family HTH domain
VSELYSLGGYDKLPLSERFMNQLGAALRSLRVFHDLSQTEAAEKLEISKSYLSEVEAGKKDPTLALLSQYAEVFSVPLSSLLFFVEQMGKSDPASIASAIAPKVLRLLDWIAEVKPAAAPVKKKPPQNEGSQRAKVRRRLQSS